MPRNTGTIIDNEGNNRTGVHLATNIIIVVDGNPVGAIASLDVNETRGGIKMIDEVGTDGHIDSAPNASTNYTISCNRTRLGRMRIAEAFGRGFTHVKSQRYPFDIEIHDRFHDADEANSIVTTIKNCWIKSISYGLSSTDWVIVDKMQLEAEDIFSVFATSNNVVGEVSAQGNPVYINSHEREADRGLYRGALSAPGILLSGFLND